MRSFVVGKVLEPERRKTPKGKWLVEFGFQVGRQAEQLAVWEDDELFRAACELKEGQRVILLVNASAGDKGRLRYYVNGLAPAPEGLREQLMSLFQAEAPAGTDTQQKKAGA